MVGLMEVESKIRHDSVHIDIQTYPERRRDIKKTTSAADLEKDHTVVLTMSRRRSRRYKT